MSTRIYLHPLRYQTARFIFIFCEHNKFSCLDFLFFLLFLGCLICFKTKGRPGSNVFPYPLYGNRFVCASTLIKIAPLAAATHGVSRRKGAAQTTATGSRVDGLCPRPGHALACARSPRAQLGLGSTSYSPQPNSCWCVCPLGDFGGGGPIPRTSPGPPCTQAPRATRGGERQQPRPA